MLAALVACLAINIVLICVLWRYINLLSRAHTDLRRASLALNDVRKRELAFQERLRERQEAAEQELKRRDAQKGLPPFWNRR